MGGTGSSERQAWDLGLTKPRRVACSALLARGADLSYCMSVHMLLLCKVKYAMTKILSVC